MMKKLAGGLTLWVATTGAAFAIFSQPESTVPEPSIGVLLVTGVLVAGGLRYLGKRKK